MASAASLIWSSTVLWSFIRYARPLNKLADWSTGVAWQMLWGRSPSSSSRDEELALLMQQQRSMEMMQYQILYLTRELRRTQNLDRIEEFQPEGSVVLMPTTVEAPLPEIDVDFVLV